MKRASVVGALLASGLAVPVSLPAAAGEAIPRPTLSITQTINGTPSPRETGTGRWQVTKPGRAASLQVTAVNAPAETTTVNAVWTSHRWRPRKGLAIDAYWDVSQHGAAAGGSGGTWVIQSRMRRGDGRWPAWPRAHERFRPAVPHVVTYTAGGRSWTEFPVRPKTDVQFQFRVRYTAVSIGLNTASFSVATTG